MRSFNQKNLVKSNLSSYFTYQRNDAMSHQSQPGELKMINSMKITVKLICGVALVANLLLPVVGQADLLGGGGSESGGGGDACEIRVGEIRAALLQWVGDGGPKELVFPADITLENYIAVMTTELVAPPDARAVVIGCVSTEQENLESQKPHPDPEQIVSVGGELKTCRGFVSERDHLQHVLCNIERFASDKTSASDQIRLIHHEFAGLGQVEKNNGAASDYEISDQITDFLAAVFGGSYSGTIAGTVGGKSISNTNFQVTVEQRGHNINGYFLATGGPDGEQADSGQITGTISRNTAIVTLIIPSGARYAGEFTGTLTLVDHTLTGILVGTTVSNGALTATINLTRLK